MAAIASSGEMRYCCSLSGLRVMTIVRWAPPNGGGAETPSRVANSGRTRFSAMSCRSPCVRDGLLKISCAMATLPVSNRVMNGGTVPAGMNARARVT